MSKYNAYAKRLNDEFIAARSAFMKLYEERDRAKQATYTAGTPRPSDTYGEAELRAKTAALELDKAENALRSFTGWERLMSRARELRAELEKDVKAGSIANPDAVDANALELLRSGAMTPDDYYAFAERYDDNPTMLKLLSRYAMDAAEDADNPKDRAALNALALNVRSGAGSALREWDALAGVAEYCAGQRGGYRAPEIIATASGRWEELTGNAIENF